MLKQLFTVLIQVLSLSLVGGDVKGKLKQFFTRVDGVHRKNGPFEVSGTKIAPISSALHAKPLIWHYQIRLSYDLQTFV